jgi:hypothetical protein
VASIASSEYIHGDPEHMGEKEETGGKLVDIRWYCETGVRLFEA